MEYRRAIRMVDLRSPVAHGRPRTGSGRAYSWSTLAANKYFPLTMMNVQNGAKPGMRRSMGVGVGALTLALAASAVQAQQALPVIDIGSRNQGSARRPAQTVQSSGLPAGEAGAETGDGVGAGSGKPILTPQNSYVVPNTSTATKTNTPIMDTPINVQVVTQKAMEDQQAITVAEALRNVSAVSIPSSAATSGFQRGGNIFVRGFLTNDIYRDGFRISPTGLLNEDAITSRQLANVQSIEVLKGPAAILYGRSEPGGIINLTTKEPEDTPHYAISQQVGSLALYRTMVNATGPLTKDKSIVYRLDMSHENNGAPFGSFIDHTRSENGFIAPVVKWKLDESTWVKAEFEYNNDVASLFAPLAPRFNGAFLTIPRNTNYSAPGAAEHLPSVFASVTLSHNFNEDWSIKQRLAMNHADISQNGSYVPAILGSGANPLLTVIGNDSWGKETSVSTNADVVGHVDTFGARHTLLLGMDYYRTSSSAKAQVTAPWRWSVMSLADPFPVPNRSLTSTSVQGFASRQDTTGVYLQDQLELPFHVFILAGARYQNIYQESSSVATLNSSMPGPLQPAGTPLSAARVTPRFGLLWRPQKWVSFYGNYTEGFSPNKGAVYGPPVALVPPSSATSWEAGAKFEFFDGRLRATADYYYLVKTNIAIADPNLTHVCGASACSLIAGKARSAGVELDVQGTLLPGWNVIVTYANQDVRVVEGKSQGAGQAGIQPGQRFPNVPRNLASLWTTYEFQNDSALKGLKFGAGYTYNGSMPYFDRTTGIPGAIPLISSWGTAELMAGYRFDVAGLKTTAQLNVTNLLDKTYYTGGSVLTNPTRGFQIFAFRSYGAPFAAAGQLRVEF